MAGMVVTWSYSSNLMSLLAVRHVPQPLHTIRQLLDQSSTIVIMEPNTAVTDTLANSKSGEFRELHNLREEGRVRFQHATTYPHALDTLVRRGDHVLITTSVQADLLISHLYLNTGRCDFYKGKQRFMSSSHCMIVQKGSPIVSLINRR
ncbi:uncharacterized protein LOC121880270 isoform X1 [Homarus americanus]|uniref:uncharacterized protein LOC121880270 isoform X1 n=1 Tax=Homarus americanus TaxID=6706 RepID=UPI001C4555F2|nr:uncharacterized protein LOC121880270 isoform X1 [Homarus americanus]